MHNAQIRQEGKPTALRNGSDENQRETWRSCRENSLARLKRFKDWIFKIKTVFYFLFSNKLSYKNLISENPVPLFRKSPIMVTGLDLNLPVMNIGGNSRPPISALSASFDQDAMCYAMFPSLSVDPTYARLKLFF